MTSIIRSAIQDIGRQVREQHAARQWCRQHPYPDTLEEILSEDLARWMLEPRRQEDNAEAFQ